jgi:transposase
VRKAGGGRKPKDPRLVFEAIVYVLRTGCQWKALPSERFGSPSAILSAACGRNQRRAWVAPEAGGLNLRGQYPQPHVEADHRTATEATWTFSSKSTAMQSWVSLKDLTG